MAKKKTKAKAVEIPVESLRHQDKRKNIPTEELRDFVAEDEGQPKVVLYPRNPSLDPQLVWKGKDEQDRQDLAIPTVPIYIQDKVHPQSIIEDFRASPPCPPREDAEQLSLFSDFNGLPDCVLPYRVPHLRRRPRTIPASASSWRFAVSMSMTRRPVKSDPASSVTRTLPAPTSRMTA
jgi:hypothetical protein